MTAAAAMLAPVTPDVVERFRAALAARELHPPEIIANGLAHRCVATCDAGPGRGTYLLNPNGTGGYENEHDDRGWETSPREPTLDERARAESSPIAYRRVADIAARAILWLWLKLIARGKISFFAGHPGLGKSQLTTAISATVSTGGLWPDGTRCKVGNVILVSAEDDSADTTRPRLEAAGADLTRVYILDAVRAHDGNGEPRERMFDLSRDIERLGAVIEEIGDVALIVIDPITAYLGDADSHKNAEIRALLAPLSKLAEKYGAAIVCVSHFNKSAGPDALLRVMGSLAFVAAARAAYAVTKDPDDPTRRLFLPLKNNIGADSTGYAFRIESVTLSSGIETSRVAWEAEPVTITANEALAPSEPDDDRTEREDAAEWLRKLLAKGPMPAKEVKRNASEAGYVWITVRRAKGELGIKPAKTRFDGGWEWALPAPKMLTEAEDAHVKTVSTLGANEHLGTDGEADL